MKHTTVQKPGMLLVGISARTSNKQELDRSKSAIVLCVMRYFHNALFNKIPNRKHPNTTICAYTDYESDHNGDYTYFIGEEVTAFPDTLPDGFCTLTIPQQQYAKFTTEAAAMPEVVINAWKKIWTMTAKDFGGARLYKTDFEVYDERAVDHQNSVVDLFIGITSRIA